MQESWKFIVSIIVIALLLLLFILAVNASGWASTTINNITNVIAGIPGQILAFLTSTWDNLSKSIQDIIQGIIGGRPVADLTNLLALARQRIADLANYFSKFFGAVSGQRLQTLLNTHTDKVGEWSRAIRDKKSVLAATIEGQARENANNLASFFHSLDPQAWKQDIMQNLFQNHIDITKNQIVANFNNNVQEVIKAFEASQESGRSIAQVISNGLEMRSVKK